MNTQNNAKPAGSMGRRRFLELSALTLAGTLSRGVSALAGIAHTAAPGVPLDQNNAQLLSAICERILPATDTPGAIAAGVPEFIADVLNTVYLEDERQLFITNLETVAAQVQADTGAAFTALDAAAQDHFLAQLAEHTGTPGGAFFTELRQLTVYGYYTSEAGATTEHRLSNPMAPWNGDLPFADVGRMWSN